MDWPENLKNMHQVDRKCKYPHENDNEYSLFESYSQSSCEFECQVEKARQKCQCTPWNIPTPSLEKDPIICDLYGNKCFFSVSIKINIKYTHHAHIESSS